MAIHPLYPNFAHFQEEDDIYCRIMADSQKPYRATPFQAVLYVIEAAAWHLRILHCRLFGHDYVDEDPSDPEVGPQPQVYCMRCHHV